MTHDPPRIADSPTDEGGAANTRPNASLRQVMSAVFWSFFGVRKGKSMAQDAVTIRPAQVIIVGVVFAAMFVATLLIVVRIILRSV